MKRLWIIALLSMNCVMVSATDITTSDGTFYQNAEIVKKTPLGFHFICNGKAGWIDYRDLPAQEAQSLGYDAAKASAFEQQLTDNQGCAMPDNAAPPADDPQLSELLQNPDNVAPTPANTTVINPGDPVTYDAAAYNSAVVAGGPVTSWVSWNGHYYPSYYWHNWYWGHHWSYWNGRYYPSHYYNHHGIWSHGHYYPYHHGPGPNPNHHPVNPPHHCNYHNGSYHHGGGGGGRR